MGYMLVLLAVISWKAIRVLTDTCASQISCQSCTQTNTYIPFLDEPEYLSKCINHILPNDDFEIVEAIGRKCERWFDYRECFAYTALSQKTKMILVGYRGTAGEGLKTWFQLADEGLVEQFWCQGKPITALAYTFWRGQVNTYFSFAFKRLFDPCIRESV
ncbi:hypothetical protein DPMN_095715 [Dreissena polymorpha]|uniref:Uncharacterized protein n=1 Tax=Dreissena polymorpha TaxID=45954 RepID=A0A9D4L7F0_DREPO|nr:hypothetical protein DPMN_095715 [Dreissena polymorpha]